MPALERKIRRILRLVFFENLAISLGTAFGISQAILAYWFVAVVRADAPPSAARFFAAVAVLVSFNLATIFALGTLRAHDVRARSLAAAYSAAGFSMAVVAFAVVAGSLGFVALGAMLGWSGATPATAFAVYRWGSIAAGGATATAIATGFVAGRRATKVPHVRIPVPGLPPSCRGLRIAHLSDLHIGNGTENGRLRRVVEQVNGLGADLIVLTGDLFDRDRRVVPEGARALAGLSAPLGVFAVLGNHDEYTGYDVVTSALSRFAPDIRVLRGEIERLDTPAPLYLGGVDDPGYDWSIESDRTRVLETLGGELPADGPCILLVHRPDAFPRAAELGFPLVLAGHYHGGQVAVPGSGGRLNPARLLTEFDGGRYRIGDSRMYVSKGIGTTGPRIRLACPPEIPLIELV